MTALSLDTFLWSVGVAAQGTVVGLLLYRKIWKRFPLFCTYCGWDLVSSILAFGLLRYFPSIYVTAYLAEMLVDSVLEFGVLVELAWSVLGPIRSSMPRSTLPILGLSVLILGILVWPLAVSPGFANSRPELRFLVHMGQTTAILRIFLFIVVAGCSQLLSINWRDRELQIATGLGFYSIVSVVVATLHAHETLRRLYDPLQQLVVTGSLFSLLYWIVCFAQKEPERREFTPQMANLLLAVAGSARSTRIALSSSDKPDLRKRNG